MGAKIVSARTCLALCLIFTFTANRGTVEGCEYVELVKCFIEVLDQWAFVLFRSKENIVTIDDYDGCQHYFSIQKCVKDEGATKHHCNKSQVLEASRTVSDLLTHRKHSGTFLKTFYLVSYACENGKEVVAREKDCLKHERIGPETLSASGYLDEQLHSETVKEKQKQHYSSKLTSPKACELLQNKLMLFQDVIGDLCNGIASKLMCKSLYDMFRNVYPDLLQNCQYDCDKENELPGTEETAPVAESNGVSQQTGNQPTAGGGRENGKGGPKTIPGISLALISLWFLVLLFGRMT